MKPNTAEAERFLHILDPDADKFVFQVIKERGKGGEAKTLFGTIAEMLPILTRYNNDGWAVYVTINSSRNGRRTEPDINRVRAVFADLDGVPLNVISKAKEPPHIVVESSPGKYHAYWLTDGLSLTDFKAVQRRIVADMGADAACCDLPRVLRLPGYWHLKNKPFMTHIIDAEEHVLPLSGNVILKIFPPIYEDAVGGGGFAEVDTHGFQAHIDSIGHHDDGLGIHQPITRAVGAYFSQYGRDAPIPALKAFIRSAVDRATIRPGYPQSSLDKVKSNFYLDTSIRGAIKKFSGNEEPPPIGDVIPPQIGPQDAPGGADEPTVPRFAMAPIDMSAALEPVEWVIDGHVEKGTNVLLWGKWDTLKTFLLIDWLLCVHTNTRWAQNQVKSGWVALICGEGYRGIARRIMAWAIKNKIDPALCDIVISNMPAAITDASGVMDVYEQIKAETERRGEPPALVGIDTVSQNFGPGDENSNTDMARFVSHVNTYITREFDTSCVFIHHPGKDAERGPRGGGALTANTDADYQLTRKGEDSVLLVPRRMKDTAMPDEVLLTSREVLLSEEHGVSSLVLVPAYNEDECQAVRLFKSGKSIREVATLTGINRGKIQRWRKKWMA